MDIINKVSWIDRIERKLASTMQKRMAKNAANVRWVSYHIPKTAGTSFRAALNDAFGQRHFYGVYRFSGAHELTHGEAIWLPRQTEVIHGHFRPHSNHRHLFPNAKRITWLRDPIKRAWSLLNHTLDVQNNDKPYQYIKTHFIDRGISDREEIFLAILADDQSRRFFNIYQRDYDTFERRFFAFVGCTENYHDDLARLAELMQRPLQTRQLNSSKSKQSVPAIPDHLKHYFDQEYRIYNKLLGNQP